MTPAGLDGARRALMVGHRLAQLGVTAAIARDGLPGQVRQLLVDLGPAYAKLGQVLSTRADVLPTAYLEEFTRLRDAMSAEDPAAIEAVLRRAFPEGTAAVFTEFDEQPVAAGTVAQVHRARLTSGQVVAVKVLRPGVRADLQRNFRVLVTVAALSSRISRSARVLDARGLVVELRDLLMSQTDLTWEARNYRRLHRAFTDHPHVVIPQVFEQLCTHEVLVTEFIDGVPPYETHRIDLDRLVLAHRVDDLMDDMLYTKGLCHADFHPGNFFWTTEGAVVLIDLGLVHELTRTERNDLLAFYSGVMDGFHSFAAAYLLRHLTTSSSGNIPAGAFEELNALVRKHWTDADGRPQFATMFPDLLRLLARHRLQLRHNYSKLFLTLVTMEGYLYWLDPAFDMLENARRKRLEQEEYVSVVDEAHDIVFGAGGSYSVAHFSGDATPAEASASRNALILDSLGVGPGTHLLDVGCGRGQLLLDAQNRGARAVGVTVSKVEHASCQARGLDTVLTSWEHLDRHRPGERADVLTVIEMDKHLATLHENRAGLLDLRLERFFTWSRAHLRDQGRLFLQSLVVPQAMLEDVGRRRDFDRLTDVAPGLGFSTLPQLIRHAERGFRVEQVHDHSADLLPTYDFWRSNMNRSLAQLRPLVGDDVLVHLRRQLDTLIWLTECGHLQLYRIVLRSKPQVL